MGPYRLNKDPSKLIRINQGQYVSLGQIRIPQGLGSVSNLRVLQKPSCMCINPIFGILQIVFYHLGFPELRGCIANLEGKQDLKFKVYSDWAKYHNCQSRASVFK